MSMRDTIAVIFDFDDTLGDDTTNLFLRLQLGMSDNEVERFWNKDVGRLVTQGWDPPLAYVRLILARMETTGQRISNIDLRRLGRRVRLYPGVPTVFRDLKAFVKQRKEFREAHVQLEFYVISGGFEEIIRGTPIANQMKDIFGCTFQSSSGNMFPASIVTFTEKTKFLYAINKGITGTELRRTPYSVNDVIPKEQRRVPFSHMIYVGDGPTDIPCFSAIQQNGGKTIGVLKYVKKGGGVTVDKRRAWAIARGERTTLGPFKPDYRTQSDLYVNLEMQIERIGLEIYDEFKRRG